MKKIHIPSIFGLIATFLFVLAITTAQVANAAPAKQSQTAGEYFDDSVVTTAVKANVLKEKGLSTLDIKVITKDGVVTLTGKADTAEHAQLAERVAGKTDGVKSVVNNLQVAGDTSQSAGEYFGDSVVTTAVKANILTEKGLSTLDIKVITKDGVVTLTGKADTAEHAQLAERVAGKADGVKSVVNNLQVAGDTSQSAGEYFDDSVVTTAVKANVLKEKGLSTLDISVKTLDGVVTLTGTTDTAEHAQLAERVAGKTDGVKRVVNGLKSK